MLSAILVVSACTPVPDSATETEVTEQWPSDLATPIEGATFPLAEKHLPGAPRNYHAGTLQGFDFLNGLSGRPLADNEPVVAVAGGEIIRIDRAHSEMGSESLAFWSEQVAEPGFVGEYALDQLRGRQVWIRHEDGHISRYAHLSEVHPELQPGDVVEQNQPVGLMGVSGLVRTEDQPDPAPRLHFELWTADGKHFLGEQLSPLETHRRVAESFGKQALPRYARRALAAVEAGDPPPAPYPPAELPDTGFNADPPASAVTGHAFAIPVTWEGEDFTSGDFFGYLEGQPLGAIDAGDGVWLLGAMPLDVENDELNLVLGATDQYGQTPMGGRPVEAIKRESVPAPLEINPEIFELHSEENLEIETQRLGPVMLQSLQVTEALWESPFSPPIDGEVIRPFGQRIFHSLLRPAHPLPGITAAAEPGAPVVAANAGRVAYAGELPIRGQTVAIVHGGGVVSVYAHLNEITVNRGDTVDRAQRIGTVGQAGATDHPQVRWEMHIGGVATDPMTWPGQMVPGGPQG